MYKLILKDAGARQSRTVEFQADDVATALIIAHKEAYRQSAELWRGDIKVYEIRRAA